MTWRKRPAAIALWGLAIGALGGVVFSGIVAALSVAPYIVQEGCRLGYASYCRTLRLDTTIHGLAILGVLAFVVLLFAFSIAAFVESMRREEEQKR